MNPRLHLLLSSGLAGWRDCCAQMAPGDCVLLVDRGAELLADRERLASLQGRAGRVCVLEDDARARGLVARPGVSPISHAEWVGLVEAHAQVLSWR